MTTTTTGKGHAEARELAHEINNVLAYLISNLQTLKLYSTRLAEMTMPDRHAGVDGDREQDQLRKLLDDLAPLLDQALEGGAHISGLVKNCLERGAPLEGTTGCPVEDAILRAVRLAADRLGDRIQVRTSFESTALAAADPGKLTQVFVNLVRNAAQAMDGQGVLTFSTCDQPGEVVAEVADTGCGIPADDLPWIFEPTYSTRENGAYHGIGLHLCLRLVKEMGGGLDVQSTLGEGTRFTLRLPAAG